MAPQPDIALAVSTRWNAFRHPTGEAIVEEILGLGVDRIELGFDLTISQAEGVRRMVEQRAVRVGSVHNFCPMPMGILRASPEVWLPASPDPREREAAVRHTANTIQFAAGLGASCVVVHAGYVRVRPDTHKLIRLQSSWWYTPERHERIKRKIITRREEAAFDYTENLHRCLDELAPVAGKAGVRLAVELLPTWEAIPTEAEAETLVRRHPGGEIAYWHDIGHGQIRENLGFGSNRAGLRRLEPWLAGMHVHDVLPPASDHLPPGQGKVDFRLFRDALRPGVLTVVEPAPGTTVEHLRDGLAFLRDAWGLPGPNARQAPAAGAP
jgi:sugar phosphate isomerase/epimerase